MNMHTVQLSDNDLRSALLREPSPGLAGTVADDVAREIAVTPQRRRAVVRWPWSPNVPALGLSLRARQTAWLVAILALVIALAGSLVLAGALLRRPAPLRNGAIAFAPPEGGVKIVDANGRNLRAWPGDPATTPTWSPDGRRLAFWEPAGRVATFWVLDIGSGALTQPVAVGAAMSLQPGGLLQWSPDGRRIISGVSYDGLPAVLIADLASGTLRRVGPESMDTRSPAWSDDGRRLLYEAQEKWSNDWRLYVADADGANPEEVPLVFPTGVGLSDYPISWSPDGKRFVLNGITDSGATMIFTGHISGGALTPLTPASFGSDYGRWSPDGSSIAFGGSDNPQASWGLYVVNADGSNLRRVATDNCGFTEWAPDGNRILFDVGLCDESAATIEVRTVRTDGTDLLTIWSEPRTYELALRGYSNGLGLSWQGIRP
jgi:dipeptidyl aminopeptidase/acylaminoacyl peptidase